MWVKATYIASKDNVEADFLSRAYNADTEWELADYAYWQIITIFGRMGIDFFATGANNKCEKYCS